MFVILLVVIKWLLDSSSSTRRVTVIVFKDPNFWTVNLFDYINDLPNVLGYRSVASETILRYYYSVTLTILQRFRQACTMDLHE